ncbi:hypothetical protein J4G37_11715 [Microvirga sp. 3-52]|nr:hypothetical protein [Microvirga sp. 3-52]
MSYRVALDRFLTRGALEAFAAKGTGTVLRQASQAWERRRPTLGLVPAGPPEKNRARGAVRLFHLTHPHRAGLPIAPPSINLTAQGSQALGLRVLAL